MRLAVLSCCILISVIILLVVGSNSPLTGLVWGITSVAIETVVFYFFFDRLTLGSLSKLFRWYALGALIRITILLVLFGAAVILLKINSFGLIAGVGVGMAVAGILSFRKMAITDSNQQNSRD